jgi:hypothetical protein
MASYYQVSKYVSCHPKISYAVRVGIDVASTFTVSSILAKSVVLVTSHLGLGLLDNRMSKYKEGVLSSLRKIILKDKKHSLKNNSFNQLIKVYAADKDEEIIKACFDLAFRLSHPNICRLSTTIVPANDYTLNFLWINLNPQDRRQDTALNIFGEGLDSSENAECLKFPAQLARLASSEHLLKGQELETWEKIKKSLTYKIVGWAELNKGATINVWYDSALVTYKAKQNTSEMMRKISESRGVDLRLRDIRQLPTVKEEIANALHPGTSLFFRVDLLKAAITDKMVQEKAKYCVVSDFDVKPMPPQEIFDARTLEFLDPSRSGYVFNKKRLLGLENDFFIFNREKEGLQKTHYETMIKRTAWVIKLLRKHPKGTYFNPNLGYVLTSQWIFSQYKLFLEEIHENELWLHDLPNPRKIVESPRSNFTQFPGKDASFKDSDYRAETFRFIGEDNVPYTQFGRNFQNGETQIQALRTWKAEPLE